MSAVIEFKDFSFRYKTQNEFTLHDINLTINSGEKVLILGPSGSGKTTLGSCINGLIPFSYNGEIKGSCKVCGLETQDASIFKISEHVGTVQQDTDAQFVGLSVGEDIAFSLENDMVPREKMLEKVDEAAKIVDMDKFLASVPYNISGGQKQKVALGGILHNNVEILLFDEPLAALDPNMGMNAVDLIDKIHSEHNKTVIIIEHRLEDVLYRKVDRIILMNEGRILLDTTPNELLRSDLLKKNGIREPLYISALKNAGIKFDESDKLESIDELDINKYSKKIVEDYKQAKVTNKEISEEKILEVKNVTFKYGDFTALKNISFDIHKGERISVVGKNGAGKSTLAKLLCGIIRPNEGEIIFNGENYLALTIKELGKYIGYVMQNPNQMISQNMIFDEVALGIRNSGFSNEEVKEKVKQALKVCGLYEFRNWPISALSFGQKKRMTIASVLVMGPKVIILDEPTAGQDYKHYTEIMEFLKELNNQGITIIMITHDMHLMLEYTPRAIVVVNGTIIKDDSASSVLCDKELVDKSSLKETSLFELAKLCNIDDPVKFTDCFVYSDKKERKHE